MTVASEDFSEHGFKGREITRRLGEHERVYSVIRTDPSSGRPVGHVQLVIAGNFEDACRLAKYGGIPMGARLEVEPCPQILFAPHQEDDQ